MEETFNSDKRKLSYELKIAKISSVKFLWSHLEDLNLFCEVWEILNGTPSQRKSSAARPRIRMKILQSLLEWKIHITLIGQHFITLTMSRRPKWQGVKNCKSWNHQFPLTWCSVENSSNITEKAQIFKLASQKLHWWYLCIIQFSWLLLFLKNQRFIP